jgi:surface protein
LYNSGAGKTFDGVNFVSGSPATPPVTCTFCTQSCSPCGGGCTTTDFTYAYLYYDFDADPSGVGDITGWNTSCITNMFGMFESTNFNQAIGSWDTSAVTNMAQIFNGDTVFNQDISGWNTSSATNMNNMFASSTFNQDISGWDVSQVTDMTGMFNNAGLSTANYDALLNGWASQPVQYGTPFTGGSSVYSSAGGLAHYILTGTYGWSISDGGSNCVESWVQNNSVCNGVTYTIGYVDENACYTFVNLPVDSGTLVYCGVSPSGDGSLGNPFQLTNCFQLANVSNDLASNYLLMNSFDCTGVTFNHLNPIGSVSTPFSGVFDGNNFVVSNVTIQSDDSDGGFWALFRYNSGTIKNLILDYIGVVGSGRYLGALVGVNSGVIDSCSVSGYVNGGVSIVTCGGLVGANDVSGVVTHSSSSVTTNCNYAGYNGGFVGSNDGSISDSYHIGSMGYARGSYTGGFVGYNVGNIFNCYSNTSMTTRQGGGGFVGYNTGIINKSYSLGYNANSGRGTTIKGGFVSANSGVIDNCYARFDFYFGGGEGGNGFANSNSGTIRNSYASGIATAGKGFITTNTGTITHSYWNTDIVATSPAGGQGLTTLQLKDDYVSNWWDFLNVWVVDNSTNDGYPSFRSVPLAPTPPSTYSGGGGSGGSRSTDLSITPIIPKQSVFPSDLPNGSNEPSGIAKLWTRFMDWIYSWWYV